MPGKFESELAEELYTDGFFDDETGSSADGNCWHGLVKEKKAIVTEDGVGFVDVGVYDDETTLMLAWNTCADSHANDRE